MKRVMLVLIGALWVMTMSSCARFSIGTDSHPPDLEWKQWGKAYAAVAGIPPYNGTIVEAQMFRCGPDTGELMSVSIWPLGFFDIGFLGLRGKLIVFEAGAGALFYAPHASSDASELATGETKE